MYIPFSKVHNIGFISTRFAGTDGVSLETLKWANVFEEERFHCFYFAGELDCDPAQAFLVPKAHFMEPEIRTIFNTAFGDYANVVRDRKLTTKIYEIKEHLKDQLYDFIAKYNIDLLVPENALTIPLNIPLGLAITELIAETGLPTIAHHHDFFWERQQFKTNSVWDYLNMAFPPHLPPIRHVVISSSASNQLSLRTGISATIIPNVMDFKHPPAPPDDYAADVRQALGLDPDERLILQPTRVVKRKGIENAIELVSRLGIKARLVISHASGDEGHDYEQRIIDYSRRMGGQYPLCLGDHQRPPRHHPGRPQDLHPLRHLPSRRFYHLSLHHRRIRQCFPGGGLFPQTDPGQPLFHIHFRYQAKRICRR